MIDPIKTNFSLISEINRPDKNEEKKYSFSEIFSDKLRQVNDLQIQADEITRDFALGKVDQVHDVTIAAEKAKLALNLTLAIHGKVVDAYNKLMRMQV